jgi:nitrite reductase/ring-hydroxylating ferredoxin subunit
MPDDWTGDFLSALSDHASEIMCRLHLSTFSPQSGIALFRAARC